MDYDPHSGKKRRVSVPGSLMLADLSESEDHDDTEPEGSDDDDEMSDVQSTARKPTANGRKRDHESSSEVEDDEEQDPEEVAYQRSRAQRPIKRGRTTGPSATTQSEAERKPGDEWTGVDGSKFRLDFDGQQRKLVQVFEERFKYRMVRARPRSVCLSRSTRSTRVQPADSQHPARFETERVLVDKWVTRDEFTDHERRGDFPWQEGQVPERAPLPAKGSPAKASPALTIEVCSIGTPGSLPDMRAEAP
jgi:hypothetical protein